MSATASVNEFGSENPGVGVVEDRREVDEITIVDDLQVTDDLELGNDGIVATAVVPDEVIDGFKDPLVPFLFLGMVTLAAIVALAAFLAL